MAKLFFVVSGEHDQLPLSELKAILEAENFSYRLVQKLDQVIRLEAVSSCTEAVKRRAAFTRACAKELFTCNADINSIVKAVAKTSFRRILKNESFEVRVKRIKNYSPEIDGMRIERALGEMILAKAADSRVDLRHSDKTFIGVLTQGRLVFGIRIADIPAKPFVERRPRRKPFFHPSAMQAKLARCMVNLTQAKSGDLVVDPFCGTGGFLVEAALIGCRVLGLDAQRRMARGTLRNLRYYQIKPEGVIVADAKKTPVTKADVIMTDPPYGTSSTTMKRGTTQLVKDLLSTGLDTLKKGRKICLAAPKALKISQLGVDLGYRLLESHLVYVHRSLTREIIVFERA